MVELIFVILAAYGAFLVLKLSLPILKLARNIIYFSLGVILSILSIIALIQAIIWLVFYPLIKIHFSWMIFSMSQMVTTVAIISFVALVLVVVLGKSTAFKQYGVLAVIINSFTTLFPILYIYSLSKQSAAHFRVANFHSKEAVFTLSIYLSSINISTYLFYGYDKFRSWIFPKDRENGGFEPKPLNHWGQKLASWIGKFAPWIRTSRVPEWVLHWLSICGGSLGAVAAQNSFRHKTKKEPFQTVYRRTAMAQIALIIGTYLLIKRLR